MSEVKVVSGNPGEVLQFGPTTIQILEDGSTTDNRLGVVASMMPPHVEGPPQNGISKWRRKY